ncbi:MAG: GH3 auxin-responsive promoter family protein [Bdellovibrionota bacterium]|nr:GH3 auxin-responsive promoter family protein [Bdellovibrionota bacterium]
MESFFRLLAQRFFYGPLLKLSVFLSYRRFKNGLSFQDKVQKDILESLLKKLSSTSWGKSKLSGRAKNYSGLKETFSLSHYDDWKEFIERERNGERVLGDRPFLFQPTSGSSHEKKWIPYGPSLMKEFHEAIGPWLFDLFKQYPKIGKGRQYWSLSWLPQEMRQLGITNDDLSYFPFFQRQILNRCLCCPPSVSLAKTMEASRLATCIYLVTCRDLSFVFIWGPTFLLELLELIFQRRDILIEMLKNGDWGDQKDELSNVPPVKDLETATLLKSFSKEVNAKDIAALWPELELISCWDTGTSASWALKLKELFPKTNIQGKGLFATEAVVTIPFEGDYLLSYRSHFYEFICLETGKVFPSWDLKEGQRVSPVISSGNGLFRYLLKDELLVTKGKRNRLSLVFQGRTEGLDLVGEKLSEKVARRILHELTGEKRRPVSLLAFSEDVKRPFYLALFEGEEVAEEELKILENKGEDLLKKHFHYRLARELNQLDPLKVKVFPQAMEYYLNLKKKGGMVEGDIKIDLLTKV